VVLDAASRMRVREWSGHGPDWRIVSRYLEYRGRRVSRYSSRTDCSVVLIAGMGRGQDAVGDDLGNGQGRVCGGRVAEGGPEREW
jgi:hypothetical protein